MRFYRGVTTRIVEHVENNAIRRKQEALQGQIPQRDAGVSVHPHVLYSPDIPHKSVVRQPGHISSGDHPWTALGHSISSKSRLNPAPGSRFTMRTPQWLGTGSGPPGWWLRPAASDHMHRPRRNSKVKRGRPPGRRMLCGWVRARLTAKEWRGNAQPRARRGDLLDGLARMKSTSAVWRRLGPSEQIGKHYGVQGGSDQW